MTTDLNLDQQLALVKPFVRAAEVFIGHTADEDGSYPSHLALAIPYMEQTGEESWEPSAEIVDLSELDEAGEFWRDAFYAAAQELAEIRAALTVKAQP